MAENLIIAGLTDEEQTIVNRLVKQWEGKLTRNILRAAYYDGHNMIRHLTSLPPAFNRVATVLGWPAKAVDTLNTRCHLEGFVVPGVDESSLPIQEIWDDNNLGTEVPQAGLSSLIHAVAWLVVHRGDPSEDEPDVIITSKDARTGTADWDGRLRKITAFLSILAVDENDTSRPSDIVLYLPNYNILATKGQDGWTVDRDAHNLGYVPVEPLVYKPRIGRPFGTSRISRAVMSMTDLAVRTVLRSEISAELYSVPQRVLLGAEDKDFKNPDGSIKAAWQVVFGRIWAIGRDEDGNMPDVKQMQQASQEPHMAQLRALAQLFAGETSIPISSLGISTESNPASAEAYYASREDLISLAESTTDGWEPAWRNTMLTAIRMKTGEATSEDLLKIRCRFRNPTHTSRASAADAMLKTIQAFPWMADSDAAIELLGFDEIMTARLLADKRKAKAQSLIQALTSRPEPATAPPGQQPPEQEPPDVNQPVTGG